MSKLMEVVRKFFSKKNAGKDSTSNDDSTTSSQNEFQKAPQKARTYDQVTLGEDGTGPKVEDDDPGPTNCQVAPKKQHSYDEVDVAPGKGGFEVK